MACHWGGVPACGLSGAGYRLAVAGVQTSSLCVDVGVLAHCLSCWSRCMPCQASSLLSLLCLNWRPLQDGGKIPPPLSVSRCVLIIRYLPRFSCTARDRSFRGGSSLSVSIFPCGGLNSCRSEHFASHSLPRVPERKQAHLLHLC